MMTYEELETLVLQLKAQVEKNTTAIASIGNTLNLYAAIESLNRTNDSVSQLSTDITSLYSSVSGLLTSIGLVNKISKLLDTNIANLTKDDLLLFDGDRWTNIRPDKVITAAGSGGSSTLEGLADVSVTNKTNLLALCWSTDKNKWINSTISTSTGGLDIPAMWLELAKSDSTNTIHPSHITGDLTIGALTTKGNVNMTLSNTKLNVSAAGVTVVGSTNISGNLMATGEVTAYN